MKKVKKVNSTKKNLKVLSKKQTGKVKGGGEAKVIEEIEPGKTIIDNIIG